MATGVRMGEGMGRGDDITKGIEAIKKVADETSWFRDTPHYWASEWLPLAYAVACVEVVCERSEKACILTI
jgi:hypothetical protein